MIHICMSVKDHKDTYATSAIQPWSQSILLGCHVASLLARTDRQTKTLPVSIRADHGWCAACGGCNIRAVGAAPFKKGKVVKLGVIKRYMLHSLGATVSYSCLTKAGQSRSPA